LHAEQLVAQSVSQPASGLLPPGHFPTAAIDTLKLPETEYLHG